MSTAVKIRPLPIQPCDPASRQESTKTAMPRRPALTQRSMPLVGPEQLLRPHLHGKGAGGKSAGHDKANQQHRRRRKCIRRGLLTIMGRNSSVMAVICHKQ